jgi:hypothetical protein
VHQLLTRASLAGLGAGALALAGGGVAHAAGDAGPPSNVTMGYLGGHVVSHVEVVVVLWGDVDPSVAATMAAFFRTITASPYLDWLGEYDTEGATVVPAGTGMGTHQHVGRGSYVKTVALAPAAGTGNLLDADVRTELARDIASGLLPAPAVDPEGGVDTLYVVYLPPGASLVGPGAAGISCVNYCAYHDTLTVDGVDPGVPYAVIPDMTAGACTEGCGAGPTLDLYTQNSSHELVEAITDPEVGLAPGRAPVFPRAWDDPADGEIADVCDEPGQVDTVAGYRVQRAWSARRQRCIAQDPALPVCGTARPCRPCVASDCGGAAPVCDAATGECRAAATPTPPDAPSALRPGGGGCDASGDALGALPPCGVLATLAALAVAGRRGRVRPRPFRPPS